MDGIVTPDTEETTLFVSQNLASSLSDSDLNTISEQVRIGFEVDTQTMSEWRKRAKEAMDLVKMKTKPKNFPFENAANVALPYVSNAVIQFASRAYPAIISDNKPVKTRPIGNFPQYTPAMGQPPVPGQPPVMGQPPVPGQPPVMGQPPVPGQPPVMGQPPEPTPDDMKLQAQKKADRVSNYMSYQLLEEQSEWEGDTDRLLHIIASIGVCWRKQYFCPTSDRIVSELVHPDRITINNQVTSLERMPRITEQIFLYPWEIKERQMDGRFINIDLTTADPVDMNLVNDGHNNSDLPPQESEDDMAPHTFYEQHTRYDLDGDGYEEPYVVTWHSGSEKIVRIVPNWDEDKGVHFQEERYTYFEFIPDPSGEFLGVGLGQLMLSLGRASNSLVNQLLDAGTLDNAGGGFIDKRSKIRPQMVNGKINQWIVADIDPQGNPFVPFPRPTPSPTLFQLLGFLVDGSKETSATTDLMTGDLTKNMQPTTVLAMIEQGTKVFNAIYKRVYRSLKREYKGRLRLNFVYGNPIEYFEFQNSDMYVLQQDFDPSKMDVVPASDPNMVSDSMEMARAGVIQSTMGHPNQNPAEALRRVYKASQIDPDGLVVDETPPDPKMLQMQAKAEIDQRRVENETRRVEAEIQERMAKIERENIKIQMEMASKPDDLELQMQQQILEERRAQLEMAKLEIEAARIEIESQRMIADVNVQTATAVDKMASAQAKMKNTDIAEFRALMDASRGFRQEDRADRQEDHNNRNEVLNGKDNLDEQRN